MTPELRGTLYLPALPDGTIIEVIATGTHILTRRRNVATNKRTRPDRNSFATVDEAVDDATKEARSESHD